MFSFLFNFIAERQENFKKKKIESHERRRRAFNIPPLCGDYKMHIDWSIVFSKTDKYTHIIIEAMALCIPQILATKDVTDMKLKKAGKYF